MEAQQKPDEHKSHDTKQVGVAEYPFLLVTPQKLAIMSVLTLGVYNIYWGYKNWKAINAAENANYHAFWRSLFSVLFIYSLFQRIDAGMSGKALAMTLGAGLIGRAPQPWWLLSTLGFIPLVMGQNVINAAHAGKDVTGKFSTKEIVFCVIGGLFWLLVLVGMNAPK